MSYIGKTPTAVPLASSDLADGIVSTDKLAANAVTTAKITDGTIAEADIANDAVTADKIANAVNSAISANTSKTTNATHSGEVTGSSALTIADNIVDEANLKVSNSPVNGYNLVARSGNTGGMTWEAPAGGTNTPNFFARSSGDQSLSAGSWTKVVFGTEDYDSASAFASSKFTVPSGQGGKYFLHASVFVGAASETSLSQQFTAFYKNGSIFRTDVSDFRGIRIHQYTATVSAVLDLSATDYIEVYVQSSATSTLTLDSSAGKGVERLTTFQGFKLIT